MAAPDVTRGRIQPLIAPEKPFDEWEPDPDPSTTVERKPARFATPTVTRAGRVIQVPNRELPFLAPGVGHSRAYRQAMRAFQADRIYRDLVYLRLHGQAAGSSRSLKEAVARRLLQGERSVAGRKRSSILAPARPVLASGFHAWPRLLQVTSFYFTIAALLAAGEIISSAAGVALAFLGLSSFCFANFSAWRRNVPNLLLGPYVAVLGMWGCFIIALAVALNVLIGP